MDRSEAGRVAARIAADALDQLAGVPARMRSYTDARGLPAVELEMVREALVELADATRAGTEPARVVEDQDDADEDDGFVEKHEAVGRMAWPPGLRADEPPHASTLVCDREACRRDASAWVRSVTGHDAQYVPFRAVREVSG